MTETPSPPQRDWPRITRRVSLGLCVSAALIAAIELTAWIARPSWAPADSAFYYMKANAALCVLLLAGGTIALVAAMRRGRAIAVGLGAVSLAIAVTTLIEHWTGWSPGLDLLFGSDPAANAGRMTQPTAAALMCFSISLIAPTRATGKAAWLSNASLVLGGLILQTMFVGYFDHATRLYDMTGRSPAARQSGLAQMLVWAGLAFGRASLGALPVFTSGSMGSAAVRMIMPAVVLLPIAVGRLQMFGEARAWYLPEYGRSLFTVLQALILGVILFAFTRYVDRLDEKYRLERERRAEAERYVAVCAWTRRIRWEGTWMSIETFLEKRFGLTPTHGISDEALAIQLATLEKNEDDASTTRR